MSKQFRVLWICDILADDELDAAECARRTIASSPYSYFEVYSDDDTQSVQVEVPNSGRYMDGGISYAQHAKTQNKQNN